MCTCNDLLAAKNFSIAACSRSDRKGIHLNMGWHNRTVRLLDFALQGLPSGHPALRWTCGSVPAVGLQQAKHLQARWACHPGNPPNAVPRLPPLAGSPVQQQQILNFALQGRQRGLRTGSIWGLQPTVPEMAKYATVLLPVGCSSHYNNRPELSRQQTAALHKRFKVINKCTARSLLTLTPLQIVNASPEHMQPYLRLMRLDRPIGTWLLYLPCTWSIGLAAEAGHLPDLHMLMMFGLGSLMMRGAGCTINDMWDKEYDSKVARTKDRPLACGQITYFQALKFLALQLSVSLAILLSFNWNTVFLGAGSLLLVVVYPLMKRITYWPQAFLGLTLNWGVMIAWSAIHGSLEPPGALLYASCVLWTMIYDTIYSHQDKEDDMMIGVKSTALKFGDDSKKWLAGFSSLMVGGLTVTGLMCDQNLIYYLGVVAVALHLRHQITTVNLNNADDCGNKFRSNKNLGLIFFALIVAANLAKKKKKNEDQEQKEVVYIRREI